MVRPVIVDGHVDVVSTVHIARSYAPAPPQTVVKIVTTL
jgi:hypothetical protein